MFVFDGKYIEEKKSEYERRQKNRVIAEKKYNKLIEKNSIIIKNTSKFKKKLRELNRDRVKLTKWDIFDAKKCLEHCGMTYIVANGEAEELCAELVLKNKVYACMSEDTDLFAYGCKRIMKCVNIYNGNFIMYRIESMLNFYNLELNDFKDICVLSSNDYSSTNKKNFIYYFKLFKKYQNEKIILNSNTFNSEKMTFIKWLLIKCLIDNKLLLDYIKNKEIYSIEKKNIISNYKYIMIQ